MSILDNVREGLKILARDQDRLDRIDRYFKGEHDIPYMPDSAEVEYYLLAGKCVTNWCPNLVGVPGQALYVDNFRRGGVAASAGSRSLEMAHWQASRLDARQASIYRAALEFGHSFVVTEKVKGKVITRGLSPRRTVALYEDAATDLVPQAALYRVSRPNGDDKLGKLIYWDSTFRYEFKYKDSDHINQVGRPVRHDALECPVTRFAAYVDLEGDTWGVVEPMIPVQDRINQTVFDLLVAQTYTAFVVRTATGLAPPLKMQKNADGIMEPVLDSDGNPTPDRQFLNASRWMYGESSDVKFGTLPAGSLDGFVLALDTALKHWVGLSQIPPHFLLGQIANVSAEALQAAEAALGRKVEEFKHSFGESWERVFRIAAAMAGDTIAADDDFGEVVWRDMGVSSLAQSADALGKFAESLDVPKEGMWSRIPGVSQAEIDEWHSIKDRLDKEAQLYQSSLGIGGADAQMMSAWAAMPGKAAPATPVVPDGLAA